MIANGERCPWLEAESAEADFLRGFILAGEDGVWALASRNFTPALKPQLDEIRTLEETCNAAE